MYKDVETGYYYLNSRYYNPEIGRFINADGQLNEGILGKNMYTYCGNSPVTNIDPTGHNFWDVLDVFSFGYSLYNMFTDPSWENLGWLALDTVSLLPIIPSLSSVKYLDNVDEIIDTASALNKIDDTSGVALQLAKQSDFTDEAWNIIQGLNRVDGMTKSSIQAGQQIHKGFRTFSSGKEFFIKGIGRFDDFDDVGKIIYELKPNNIRSIRRGINQLNRYNDALGGGYKMILILY